MKPKNRRLAPSHRLGPAPIAASASRLTVERLAELHGYLRKIVRFCADLGCVLARGGRLEFREGCFDRLAIGVGHFVAQLLDCLFCRVDERLGLVLGLDGSRRFLSVRRMRLRILHHAIDFGIAQPARSLDSDLLRLVRRLVERRHVHDAVGVDVEGDLDLRHAARRGRNAHEIELAEQLVIRGHLALALEDADRHRVLIILGGREDLTLLGGDRRVAIDQRVKTPPSVSMPSESGVTSSRRTSFTSP